MTVFVILRYILGCVVLYNKITMSVTPNNITINPPYKQRVQRVTIKTTYGLYQYRIIPIMNEWKRVPYTIYQQMKRYNHFNTTIYHTGQERGYKALSTYFNSTTYHHITLPQDERTTTNNIFILQPTRELYTTDGTIPPYKTTSI